MPIHTEHSRLRSPICHPNIGTKPVNNVLTSCHVAAFVVSMCVNSNAARGGKAGRPCSDSHCQYLSKNFSLTLHFLVNIQPYDESELTSQFFPSDPGSILSSQDNTSLQQFFDTHGLNSAGASGGDSSVQNGFNFHANDDDGTFRHNRYLHLFPPGAKARPLLNITTAWETQLSHTLLHHTLPCKTHIRDCWSVTGQYPFPY